MNRSFEPLKLVNTYGAFGSVGKQRDEITIQAKSAGGRWKEYAFQCKPGPVRRRPCVLGPYHLRLDWLAWFAGFQTYQHQPWLVHLVNRFPPLPPLVILNPQT